MTILDKITAYKLREVASKKDVFPISLLEKSVLFERNTLSMSAAIRNSANGIIAEHKRRSPSKSVINEKVSIQDVAQGYETAGVSAMSVLTDTNFFGGSLDDLLMARAVVSMPILRKDFIIDPYQIIEAKAYGADTILLIAACLPTDKLIEFSTLATSLNMEVLLEVHNKEELDRSLLPNVAMLGVNNRNLKTFNTTIETSKALSTYIPDEFVRVSESGISSPETIKELRSFGYSGFLIGENFMKTEDPGNSAAKFIDELA